VNSAKKAALVAVKMDKTPGANINHVFLGLPMFIGATTKDITLEGVKNMVVINWTDLTNPILIKGNQADQVEAGT